MALTPTVESQTTMHHGFSLCVAKHLMELADDCHRDAAMLIDYAMEAKEHNEHEACVLFKAEAKCRLDCWEHTNDILHKRMEHMPKAPEGTKEHMLEHMWIHKNHTALSKLKHAIAEL